VKDLIDVFFNLEVFWSVLPLLLTGLKLTLLLSTVAIALGLALGLAVALALTQRRSRILRYTSIAYIDLFRALPPLVLLIFVSFMINFWGFKLPNWIVVAICFMFSSACYYGEILRAGIEAIPTGQIEASRSTGMGTYQTLRYVVLPQAFRNANPEICSNSLQVIKMTTIASVLGMPELLRMARDAQSLLYSPAPLVLAALIYMVLLWPVVRWVSNMSEKKAVR
jgi:polar amino acid transport system permease protein